MLGMLHPELYYSTESLLGANCSFSFVFRVLSHMQGQGPALLTSPAFYPPTFPLDFLKMCAFSRWISYGEACGRSIPHIGGTSWDRDSQFLGFRVGRSAAGHLVPSIIFVSICIRFLAQFFWFFLPRFFLQVFGWTFRGLSHSPCFLGG